MEGELTSGRYEDPRLPQLLADVRAKFHADNRGVELSEVWCINGPTMLRFSGGHGWLSAAVAGDLRGDVPATDSGRSAALADRPAVGADFAPNLLAQLRKFQPYGEVNVEVAKAEFDGQRWKADATVECLSMSFTYDKFPYRLERGTGSLRLVFDEQFQQNRLTLRLLGYAGNQPVHVEGDFLNPGPDFTGGVTLKGDELPFDRNLYEAIAESQPTPSQVVQSLNFQGTFNLSANICTTTRGSSG